MGRKLIYKTEKEQKAAHTKRSLEYYYKHKEECKKKRMERYYEREKSNNK
jgi:hypothetical protein